MFCGSGNFTEVMSSTNLFKELYAVEVASNSLQELEQKKIEKVKIFECDLFHEKQVLRLAKEIKETEVLLLDPPREGWTLLASLVESLPRLKTILYVSCDLQTFFRDLRSIEKLGFKASKIQPVDLFPQTPHLEILAVIRRA